MVIAGVVRALLPTTVDKDEAQNAVVIAELKRLLTVYIVVGITGAQDAAGNVEPS